MPLGLEPFWRYYGGKWRAAPRYPAPAPAPLGEPFAGAAGYSLRYYDKRVILVEKYPVVAEIWRYLIGARSEEVLSIPLVEHVDELPSRVPEGARWLVGFAMNAAVTSPRSSLSAGRKRLREKGRNYEGWSEMQRARVARQVDAIKHWKVFELGYEETGSFNPRATWFVDPPYKRSGVHYVHSSKSIDYAHLADYCRSRRGQVIVLEEEGADWLPFRAFGDIKSSGMRGKAGRGSGVSRGVVWYGGAI